MSPVRLWMLMVSKREDSGGRESRYRLKPVVCVLGVTNKSLISVGVATRALSSATWCSGSNSITGCGYLS